MQRHYSIQRNFSLVSLKNFIQVSDKVLVTDFFVFVWLKTGIYVKEPRCVSAWPDQPVKGNQFQRENFHSDRVSRSKLPDNSAQWKAPQVCLCHLFKYAVSRAKYVSRAGPICRFARDLGTLNSTFKLAPRVGWVVQLYDHMTIDIARQPDKGTQLGSCNQALTLIN